MTIEMFLKGFKQSRLFDRKLFDDYINMSIDELSKWNEDFVHILSGLAKFNKPFSDLIEFQKNYYNSWLALNYSLINKLED